MPTIDLGVSFDDIKDEDQFTPMPNGTYEFTVADVESTNSKGSKPPGRPMLKWTLKFPFEGSERSMFIYTVLPWVVDGEQVLSGVSQLVAITKAIGQPWVGKAITTEDYLGKKGKAVVKQKQAQMKDDDGNSPTFGTYIDDPDGGLVNDIKKFVY
jgi:hypothetical protein